MQRECNHKLFFFFYLNKDFKNLGNHKDTLMFANVNVYHFVGVDFKHYLFQETTDRRGNSDRDEKWNRALVCINTHVYVHILTILQELWSILWCILTAQLSRLWLRSAVFHTNLSGKAAEVSICILYFPSPFICSISLPPSCLLHSPLESPSLCAASILVMFYPGIVVLPARAHGAQWVDSPASNSFHTK